MGDKQTETTTCLCTMVMGVWISFHFYEYMYVLWWIVDDRLNNLDKYKKNTLLFQIND